MVRHTAYILIIRIFWGFTAANAQELNSLHEQYIENILEALSDKETEEVDANALFEDLYFFLEQPLNLNSASYEDLTRLKLLNEFQIKSLLDYRKKYGLFVSMAELNYVFGFDWQVVELIAPFVLIEPVGEKNTVPKATELSQGKNEVIIRTERVLNQRKGYLPDSSSQTAYLGSPWKVYTRYNYKLYDKLKFGFIAEKDPGEEFFQGSNKQGFDFYSAHLQFQSKSLIRKLTLGDFHMETGQGLLIWSGYGLGKSSSLQTNQRRGRGLRVSNSADENRFFRGTGICLGYKAFELSLFGSLKHIDAGIENNLVSDAYISGLYTSGLHNTTATIEKKNTTTERVLGGSVQYKGNKLNLGFNAVQTQYDIPLKASESLYKLFSLSGNSVEGISVNYQYLHSRFQLFGEVANSHSSWANLHGATIYLSSEISLIGLYRNYQKDYFAPYNNAFSENSGVLNENGVYLGLDWRLASRISLIAYMDIFEFLWLRYQVNAPSKGKEYLLESGYKLSENCSFYIRYKFESKGKNQPSTDEKMTSISYYDAHQVRFHISWKLSKQFGLKSRLEWKNTGFDEEKNENGFLIYQDIDYTLNKIPLSLSLRYAYFNTSSYDSRLYAYEKNVRYSFTTPAYFDNGHRIYLLAKYEVSKWLQIYLRLSTTKYQNKDTIGSGLDEIQGSQKYDMKMQCIFRF